MADDSIDMQEPVEKKDETVVEQSRRDARSLVFHLLYMMEEWNYDILLSDLIDNTNKGFDVSIDQESDIAAMAAIIIEKREELDDTIRPLLANWRLERLGVCTRLILRMAAWELKNTELAPQIVINEAIELAKCFAEKDAYKFINGVLDEMMKRK